MNSIPMMVDYKSPQKLHPLSMFVQLVSREFSGQLAVTNGLVSWLIYLERGKLTFATNSDLPLDRLDRHLYQLSRQVPTLTSATRGQVRQQFGSQPVSHSPISPDYEAIHWLIEQDYLNLAQATLLIEELAKEVIEPFLAVTEGSYELVHQEKIAGFTSLCQLELRPLVEHCQMQLRRQPTVKPPSVLSKPPTVLPQNSSREANSPTQNLTARKTADATRIPAKGTTNSTTNTSTSKHYTIACIDDSPTVLEAISSFLGEANFSVVMINDPLKALMQVIRTKPDMVLLDVGMPNLDGYELCSLLRRNSAFKQIPILMVTGHTGFIDRAKAKLVGATGYLTKPFTRSELLKMVFKHLS
jgi:twitching motility two-component system response regulator PilG